MLMIKNFLRNLPKYITFLWLKIKLAGLPRAKTVLNGVLAYLTIIGVISFSLFLFEESAQMLSFANFSASDTKRYDLMKTNLNIMSDIMDTAESMNRLLYILNPFQHKAYSAYVLATRAYISTLEGEILANAPELYINEKISMTFKPDSYSAAQNNLFIAENRSIKVILKQAPASKTIQVTGMAQADPDKKDGIIIINQEN